MTCHCEHKIHIAHTAKFTAGTWYKLELHTECLAFAMHLASSVYTLLHTVIRLYRTVHRLAVHWAGSILLKPLHAIAGTSQQYARHATTNAVQDGGGQEQGDAAGREARTAMMLCRHEVQSVKQAAEQWLVVVESCVLCCGFKTSLKNTVPIFGVVWSLPTL